MEVERVEGCRDVVVDKGMRFVSENRCLLMADVEVGFG